MKFGGGMARVENLNFCKQMSEQFSKTIKRAADSTDNKTWFMLMLMANSIKMAKESIKFILPENGRLYDDPELKALDDSVPLRLPFNKIALEYTRNDDNYDKTGWFASKAIVFAKQNNEDEDISIRCAAYSKDFKMWTPLFHEIIIPKTEYKADVSINGRRGTKLYVREFQVVGHPDLSNTYTSSDYEDEVGALLSFLNILNCNNVELVNQRPTRHQNLNNKKTRKNAFSFDSYKILAIKSPITESVGKDLNVKTTHRSPREHVRRGHIRRISNHRTVWVNSAIVGARKGFGRVYKDYAII